MMTLRWILGVCLTVCMGGFIALAVIGGGFRRSFGASYIHPLLVMVPLLAIALLLLALVFPQHKLLLHSAAVGALLLDGVCAWQIVAEGAAVLWLVLLYLALWLVFYWQTAWASP